MNMNSVNPSLPRSININTITEVVISESINIHKNIGAGLLESVYEAILQRRLELCGLFVERQKPIAFQYKGLFFDEGFRIDLLVERKVVIELKSIEKITPVHQKQLLTYLKLLNLPVGLLINFGGATLKEGLQRVVNNYAPEP